MEFAALLLQPSGVQQGVDDGRGFVGCHPFHVKGKRTFHIGSGQALSTTEHDGEGSTNVVDLLTHGCWRRGAFMKVGIRVLR